MVHVSSQYSLNDYENYIMTMCVPVNISHFHRSQYAVCGLIMQQIIGVHRLQTISHKTYSNDMKSDASDATALHTRIVSQQPNETEI